MFEIYDRRGAEYPSEHNVGHEYVAKKDLLNFYKENNLDFKVLKSAIDVNNIIREKYNDDPREMEQRINFKKEIT